MIFSWNLKVHFGYNNFAKFRVDNISTSEFTKWSLLEPQQ